MGKRADGFGSVIGGNPAKANAVLSLDKPKTMAQIIAEGNLHGTKLTVYQHLNRLVAAGYVRVHDDGKERRYSLTPAGLAKRQRG